MSENFQYVNHSKLLRFAVGDFGVEWGFDAIGSTLWARAFCLLLTRAHDRAAYRHYGMGAWIGDQVACLGDHGDVFEKCWNYTDVAANCLLLIYEVDGPAQLMEYAELFDAFFVELAHLATTQHHLALQGDFVTHFGPQWQTRLGTFQQQYNYRPKDLANVAW